MTDPAPTDCMTAAVERYLATADSDDNAAGTEAAVGSADAATFARCDAVLALLPRLADSPDLAWAFDEARDLARFRAWSRRGSSRGQAWYRSPCPAWVLTGLLAAVLVITAVPWPSLDEPLPAEAERPVASITFAPIVISTELANALAEVQPVALLADQTPVDSRSLAVLPFTARPASAARGDPRLSAASIYGQVLGQLATVPGLYLVDPATATAYSNSSLPPEQIAQQLGVRGIVEGSIDLVENGIRFELSFTDAASTTTAAGSVSESIERPTEELALLQTDITSSVLDALARQPPPIPQPDFSR